MQAYTILTRSSTALVERLNQLSHQYKDHILLFTLSANVSAPKLSNIVQSLTTFSRTTSLGCLSAPLPGLPRIACSLAFFHPSEAIPFRSTIPGRAAAQVGRWHASRNRNSVTPNEYETPNPNDKVNWAEVWEHGSTTATKLPPQLENLRSEHVNEVLYLTDLAPEGLINSLVAFPDATQLGLITASTPFVTGRPVTLFYNDQIFESGAVGLALKHSPPLRSQTQFSDVSALSQVMTITSCEGNMVNTIDNANPTQLLLQTIQKSGMEMESSGSFKDNETFLLGAVRDDKIYQMYTITAGDLARGNISLASQRAPDEGTKVQFFHRSKSAKQELSKLNSIKGIRFITCAEEPLEPLQEDAGDAELLELKDTFIAASENGFVLSQPKETTWTCTVPGGAAWLE